MLVVNASDFGEVFVCSPVFLLVFSSGIAES